MECERCHKNEATINLVRKVGDQVTKHFLCKTCAGEFGLKQEGAKFTFESILAALADLDLADSAPENIAELTCLCGHTFNQFRKRGRLGCSQCYTTFRRQLAVLLKKIHGDPRHLGKVPPRQQETIARYRELQELKDELEKAVQCENYERAAELRDQIKSLVQAAELEAGTK